MGTRADFYLGRGKDAKWLGSVSFDGYPEGIDSEVLTSKTEQEFISRLETFFAGRDDHTSPDMGWPWPWETSKTTDYAYSFDGVKVWASCFGSNWFNPLIIDKDGERIETDVKVEFPEFNTKNYSAKAGSVRSGIMVFTR